MFLSTRTLTCGNYGVQLVRNKIMKPAKGPIMTKTKQTRVWSKEADGADPASADCAVYITVTARRGGRGRPRTRTHTAGRRAGLNTQIAGLKIKARDSDEKGQNYAEILRIYEGYLL